MIYFFVFIIGLFVGSFLNVVVDRLRNGESIVKGRSHCDYCKKELKWIDLIPLLSYIFLKGKCRYCHKKLEFYYPIIELTTGILFALSFIFIYGPSFQIFNFNLQFLSLIFYLFLMSCFIVIFFEDLKFGIIPDVIVFPAVAMSVVYLIISSQLTIPHLLSAFGAFLFFLLLFLFTKGKGMGFGDVKLVFLLGLILGFPKIVLSLYIAFLTGAFFGLILILWKKKRSIKDTIPFGPFLIAGALISLF